MASTALGRKWNYGPARMASSAPSLIDSHRAPQLGQE